MTRPNPSGPQSSTNFVGVPVPTYNPQFDFSLGYPKERLVVRIDYARGREDGQMYFSVGEAF